MKKAQLLHQAAMDIYDLGRIAKAKGKSEIFEEYLPIAFLLDKEAAYAIQSNPKESVWKYCYPRSAAWLAIEAKLFDDAKKLALLGLHGNPSDYEKYELEKALKVARENLEKSTEETTNSFQITGTLTAINIDENQISIRENGEKEYKIIELPSDSDFHNIGLFIGRWVEVEAQQIPENKFILKNINLAA